MKLIKKRVHKSRGVFDMVMSGMIAFSFIFGIQNGTAGTVFIDQEPTLLGLGIHLIISGIFFHLTHISYNGICHKHANVWCVEFF